MNQDTINRLKEMAPSIEKLRNLQPGEQEWLEPLLHSTTKTALAILNSIVNTHLTYQEIADECELHVNTVKQYLYALSDGGCLIDMTQRTAYAPTGRPRNLSRR